MGHLEEQKGSTREPNGWTDTQKAVASGSDGAEARA